jgi:tRNA A-37 threonylcarbamoyl transferase component Bud32
VYDRKFDWRVTKQILLDVAEAAVILHSKGLCHGDLYGHNIQLREKNY